MAGRNGLIAIGNDPISSIPEKHPVYENFEKFFEDTPSITDATMILQLGRYYVKFWSFYRTKIVLGYQNVHNYLMINKNSFTANITIQTTLFQKIAGSQLNSKF